MTGEIARGHGQWDRYAEHHGRHLFGAGKSTAAVGSAVTAHQQPRFDVDSLDADKRDGYRRSNGCAALSTFRPRDSEFTFRIQSTRRRGSGTPPRPYNLRYGPDMHEEEDFATRCGGSKKPGFRSPLGANLASADPHA